MTIMSFSNLKAQSILWGTCTGNDLEVLFSAETTTYQFTNTTTPLTAATVEVQLGVGIEYVAGSFSYTSSGSAIVTESSSTGDNLVVFNVGAIAVNEVISITFPRQASCAARSHKISSGSFEDVAGVYEGGIEVTYLNNAGNPYEFIYDVTYANIIVSGVTHTPSALAAVGDTLSRSVTITNGGFGTTDQFWYQDIYDITNVSLSNFTINGTTIAPGKIVDNSGVVSIIFDSSNIPDINGSGSTQGDGDAFFEKDEFFILNYDVVILNCSSGNIDSDLKGFYGVDINSSCDPSGSTTTSVTINNGSPQLDFSVLNSPSSDFCLTTTHSIRIINTGSGPEDFAKDLVFFFGFGWNSDVSTMAHVDVWGSSLNDNKHLSNFTINGNSVTQDSILGDYDTFVDYIPFDFFSADPDANGSGLEDIDGDGFYDDLAAGDTLEIGFDLDLSPSNETCGQGIIDYIRWEPFFADIEWSNQCGVLQSPARRSLSNSEMYRNLHNSTFVDGPTDIDDSEQFTVKINPHLASTVRCNGESSTTGTDVTFTVKCILPAGVTLQAGATVDPHHSGYNPSLTQSNDTVYYEINRYNRDWYSFPLEFDCVTSDSLDAIDIDFVTTYACGSCFEIDMHCETVTVSTHCPDPCVGLRTTDFSAHRTTPGWTDETMTTPVTLNSSNFATDHMIPFDTVLMQVKGIISDTTSDNIHLRITYTPDFGDNIFDFVGGEITIFDIDGTYGSTSNTFALINPPTVSSTSNPGNDTYYWEFDLSNFITNIDPNYELGEGMELDSFEVNIDAVYNSNPGYEYYKVNDFNAEFFMVDALANERSCDTYSADMSYTGFQVNGYGYAINMNGCATELLHATPRWLSDAGDIFPNEYRPIAQLDSMIFNIPDGIKFLDIVTTNSLGDLDYHVNANGDVVVYPGVGYFPNNWTSSQWPTIYVHVKPTCELATGEHIGGVVTHSTIYNYHPNTSLHQQIVITDGNFPRVQYNKPNFTINPINQFVAGVGDSVIWELEACNASSGLDIEYHWVILDNSSSNGITINKVLDNFGNEIVTTDFGSGQLFVPLGNIDGGNCTNFKVVANYTSCDPDDLIVDFGWACDAYPTNISEISNCAEQTFVRVIPSDPAISVALTPLFTTPSDPSNPSAGNYASNEVTMCENFPVEFRIISSGNATMHNINFDLIIPNTGAGLEYIANSATIEVEGVDATNSPRAIDAAGEAAFVAATAALNKILIEDLDATNFGSGQGLLGAGEDPNKNEIIIRFLMRPTCDLTSGKRLKVRTFGESSCGNDASGNGEIVNTSSLDLVGITSPYIVTFAPSIAPDNTFLGCSDTKTYSIDLNVVGGPTANSDTVFVSLPQGLTYNGSFNCTSTNCPTFEGTRMEAGNEIVLIKLPNGSSNIAMSINFELGTDSYDLCSNAEILLSSESEIGGLFCSLTGVNCPFTTVETGNNSSAIEMVNPELEIGIDAFVKTIGTPNQFDYEITINNNSTVLGTSGPVTIDFYEYDATNDTITGSMIATVNTTAAIAANGTEQVTGYFPTLNELDDGVVAVIDRSLSQNCSCPHPNGMDDNPTNTSAFILPVNLSKFEGKVSDECTININWQTESEENAAYFEVQWSEDGTTFRTIHLEEAKGGSFLRNYAFHDRHSKSFSSNYYRLKSVDFDGSFEYSDIIRLKSNCTNINDLKAFPNPIYKEDKILNIDFVSENEMVQLQIFDTWGRTIDLLTINNEFNSRVAVALDISKYTSGTYLIKVVGARFNTKFIVTE